MGDILIAPGFSPGEKNKGKTVRKSMMNKGFALFRMEWSSTTVKRKYTRFAKMVLIKLGLNDRQLKAILFVQEKGRITNSEYQALNETSKRTATYELTQLIQEFNLLKKSGVRGAGVFYTIMGQ